MIIISNYQNAKDISDKFVAMEGLMEKLPMNKKKATLLKTWKRRFFRAKDGWLYYYEVRRQFPNRPFPTGLSFQNTCKACSPLFHFQSSPFSKTNESSFWLSDQIFDQILSEGPRVSLIIFSHGLEYGALMLHFTHSVNLWSQCNLSFIDWVSLLMILDLFHRPVTVTSQVTPCS